VVVLLLWVVQTKGTDRDVLVESVFGYYIERCIWIDGSLETKHGDTPHTRMYILFFRLKELYNNSSKFLWVL